MGCEPRKPGWYRTEPQALQEEHAVHGTFQAIAGAHGGDMSTYVKWWGKHGLPQLAPGPKPGTNADRTSAHLRDEDVDVTVERLDDIHQELWSRGLNPDEWVVIRVVVNTWDTVIEGAPEALKQLKVTLRPRLDALLRPAVIDSVPNLTHGRSKGKDTNLGLPGKKAKDKPGTLGKPRLVVFVGDEQAPYHDPDLHQLFCQWLGQNKPDQAVHMGDLMDFPTLSRHRPNPVWNATPQECVNAAYRILHNYREASPDTEWSAIPGNHDERLRDYQLQRAASLYGLRPADLEDQELAALHSIPTLLHLPTLRIEWAGSDGDYEHSQVDVSPVLAARHGFITGANSADKTVRKLGLNVVVGHTHRQVITYVTEERMRETLVMLCVETGCMCLVEGGLGYAVNPNWQQGFATASVWPDGRFVVDHGTFREGVLTWRDQRFGG